MLKLNKTNKDLLSVQHKIQEILCFQIKTERQFFANPAYNYNFVLQKRSTSVHFTRTKNLHKNINNLIYRVT